MRSFVKGIYTESDTIIIETAKIISFGIKIVIGFHEFHDGLLSLKIETNKLVGKIINILKEIKNFPFIEVDIPHIYIDVNAILKENISDVDLTIRNISIKNDKWHVEFDLNHRVTDN